MDKIEELLTRGVANIIPSKEELAKTLRAGRKLNVYLGIDPTATQIHLGHAVPLRKLQTFAELKHNVTFLIGDFTALIGDASDKDSERPVLSKEQIEQNFQTYKKQAEKILDLSKVKVRHNSEWLKKLSFEDIVKLCQHFSFGDFAGRELVKKRLGEGRHIGLHEALYPVMQGYDSYYLDTDVQIGGTDQTFNMQAGRTLQKNLRDKQSYVFATEFLLGTDGRKMSKTWGNAIWLTDEPNAMYGKIMSIADELLISYFTLGTNTPLEEIDKLKSKLDRGENPMNIKKLLADRIVTELHSSNEAQKAKEYFEEVVQNREIPSKIPLIHFHRTEDEELTIVDMLVKAKFVSSRLEAKRLIEQGAIEIDGKRVDLNLKVKLKNGMTIKYGKRKFVRISEID